MWVQTFSNYRPISLISHYLAIIGFPLTVDSILIFKHIFKLILIPYLTATQGHNKIILCLKGDNVFLHLVIRYWMTFMEPTQSVQNLCFLTPDYIFIHRGEKIWQRFIYKLLPVWKTIGEKWKVVFFRSFGLLSNVCWPCERKKERRLHTLWSA